MNQMKKIFNFLKRIKNIMRKVLPQARFNVEAYDTFLDTTDKTLAGIVFKYLGRSVPALVETADKLESYSVTNNLTCFSTTDKKLALLVLKYARDNQEDPLEDVISNLEADL